MLDVVVAGLGYFSQFHLAAWAANPNTHVTAACDPNPKTHMAAGDVPVFPDLGAALAAQPADVVDIIAPPPAHADLIQTALAPGRIIICQKPFATSVEEATALTQAAEEAGATLVIHENFRFQPWYRALKTFLQSGRMGQVYQAHFALRPGDGRGPDAYLARQPFFQTMPRLLIHETGVHFIDLFRWLFGDITEVYADIRRLNPAIAGEDAGLLILTHDNGTRAVFDGNRLSDLGADNPRLTMGVLTLEGEGGTVTLAPDGTLLFRPFGKTETEILPNAYPIDTGSFGGGCVAALIDHVVAARLAGQMPENTARDYLKVVRACAAAYRSAEEQRKISL